MGAEAGHDLVEDQADAGLLRNGAEFVCKLARLHAGMAALHRLEHHAGQLARMLADPGERGGCAIFQHDIVAD